MMRSFAQNIINNPDVIFSLENKAELEKRESYFAAELLEARLLNPDDLMYHQTIQNDLSLYRTALTVGRFLDPEAKKEERKKACDRYSRNASKNSGTKTS